MKATTKLAVQAFTELIGMFIFLFISFGGVQSALRTSSPAQMALNPTLAFIGLATAIFFSYRISGGALNPAVNFGLFIAGAMDIRTALAYTAAQAVGAVFACLAVAFTFPGDFKGANEVFAGVALSQAFMLETVLSAGLVLTVLFLAVEKSRVTFWAPMMIGIYVFTAHLVSIPYTNTSINPARSFGAALVTGNWDNHALFWLAPLSGGALAGLLYNFYKRVGYEQLNPDQDADGVRVVVARKEE